MANFLDKTGLSKVLSSLKTWILDLFSNTLVITDDNWRDYVINISDVVFTPSTVPGEWVDAPFKSIYGPLFNIPGNIRTVIFDMKTINIFRFRACCNNWKDGSKLSFMVAPHKSIDYPTADTTAYDKYVSIDECIYSNTATSDAYFNSVSDIYADNFGEFVVKRDTYNSFYTTATSTGGYFYPYNYISPTTTDKKGRDIRSLIPGKPITAVQYKKRWYYEY